jgi:hypothetical protein
VPADDSEKRALSFGDVESRPAVKLMPRVTSGTISWGQDRRYLVLKAVAYLASPAASDTSFWSQWEEAVRADSLRSQVFESGDTWKNASSLDLLVEMFAAYALNPGHTRWADLPAVRSFLEAWR